jgi:hypothetical protein
MEDGKSKIKVPAVVKVILQHQDMVERKERERERKDHKKKPNPPLCNELDPVTTTLILS